MRWAAVLALQRRRVRHGLPRRRRWPCCWRRWRPRPCARRRRWWPAWRCCCWAWALAWHAIAPSTGCGALAHARSLSVALLQGNIPQDEKFQPGSGVPTSALVRRAGALYRCRPGGGARDGDPAAAPATGAGLPGGDCRRATPAAARHCCWAYRWATWSRGLHQLGAGLRAGPAAAPLRQAPPGAVWRVHPAVLPLVHRDDDIPLGDFNAARANSLVSPGWASASRPTSATRTCLARNWARAFADPASRPHHHRQPEQHRLVLATPWRSTSTWPSARMRALEFERPCCAPPTPAPRPHRPSRPRHAPPLPAFQPRRAASAVQGRTAPHALRLVGGALGLAAVGRWALARPPACCAGAGIHRGGHQGPALI